MKQFIWNLLFKNDPMFVYDQMDTDEQLIICNDATKSDAEKIALLKQDISNYQVEIAKLKEFVIVADPDEEYYDNKYVKSNIAYKGRSLPYSTTPCFVPVSVLITPNDPFILQDLRDWGMMGDKDTNWEKHIPKIYKRIKDQYYNYDTDINVWGNAEVWEFPFELRAKAGNSDMKADCDSWAVFQASYYIAAGFPAWRIRVTAGMTSLGGHATVYIYSKEKKRFVHLNSTYGQYYPDLKSYPTHDDAIKGTDKIGISQVWFSFNNKYSWYKFEDELPEGFNTEARCKECLKKILKK